MNYQDRPHLKCCWNCYFAQKIDEEKLLYCKLNENIRVYPSGICEKFGMKRTMEQGFNPFNVGGEQK